MSSLCGWCEADGRRRETPDGLLHLHSLEPGDAFRDHRGEIRRVLEIGEGRVKVTGGAEPEEVEFETSYGKQVSFERSPSSDGDWWSPTTQVRPVA